MVKRRKFKFLFDSLGFPALAVDSSLTHKVIAWALKISPKNRFYKELLKNKCLHFVKYLNASSAWYTGRRNFEYLEQKFSWVNDKTIEDFKTKN